MALTKVRGAGAEGLTLSTTDLIIDSGDLVFSTADKGVVLGATSNTDANKISDYEEGAWTPAWHGGFTSVSYPVQRGSYTKVGTIVSAQADIKFTGTNAGAQLILSGLPFTVANQNNGYASSSATIQYSTISTYANDSNPTLYVAPNTTLIYFYANNGGVVSSNANASNDWIQFTAIYQTES